jgi:hypothetical protein
VAEVADVGFEAVAAVREFRSYRGQRHFPGWYYAATMDAHVGFESWLERDLIRTLRRVIRITESD